MNQKLATLCNKIPQKMNSKEELKDMYDKMKERDETLITGVFRNLEEPGKSIKIPFRKHGRQVNVYTLHDGMMHTIPYGLAHHLEYDTSRITYAPTRVNIGSKITDQIVIGAATEGMEGQNPMFEQRKTPRYAFLSTDLPPRQGNIPMAR